MHRYSLYFIKDYVINNICNIIIVSDFISNDWLELCPNVNAQVVPSLWEEASGMVAIEGNYCGLPQIITNSGGLPENVSSSAIIIDKNKDVVSQLKEAIVKVKNKKITNSRDVKALTAKDYFNEFVKIINKFEENNGEN